MASFGDRLRAGRVARGLTQDELAELLSVTKSSVSAWENDREYPAFDKLARLKAALHVSLDHLVCGDYQSTGPPGAKHVREGAQGDDGELSRDEIRLLRRIRGLTERRRKGLIAMLSD